MAKQKSDLLLCHAEALFCITVYVYSPMTPKWACVWNRLLTGLWLCNRFCCGLLFGIASTDTFLDNSVQIELQRSLPVVHTFRIEKSTVDGSQSSPYNLYYISVVCPTSAHSLFQ